jgi:hypothetical protein
MEDATGTGSARGYVATPCPHHFVHNAKTARTKCSTRSDFRARLLWSVQVRMKEKIMCMWISYHIS